MKTRKYLHCLGAMTLLLTATALRGAGPIATPAPMAEPEDSLQQIAFDAFVYAYPMLEQVKTVNGMQQFMGMQQFNQPATNPKLPWENVGMPIVAPNLTSMTGGILLDLSGPKLGTGPLEGGLPVALEPGATLRIGPIRGQAVEIELFG